MTDTGPDPKPQAYEVDTQLPGSCDIDLCEHPRYQPPAPLEPDAFCAYHVGMLELHDRSLVDGWRATQPGTPARYDAVWRAQCALARLECRPYRRQLFDGTVIDSGR